MTSKAFVRHIWERDQVAVAVMHVYDSRREVLQWPETQVVRTYDLDDGGVEGPPTDWLHLNDADARALYEALADHYGHSGHDTRALRKDYEAERGRVDKLITHLTGASR